MLTQHELAAGALLRFDFPELPETLYAMTQQVDKQVARLQACLPSDYTLERQFPILVFLQGGAGASGEEAEVDNLRRLTGDSGFIGVSLPLFKATIDPQDRLGGILIDAFDDYPVMANCYRLMLTRLFQAIPNIAPGQGILGGFSNGAHATALLLSAVDPFILEHFTGYYFLDGDFIIPSLFKRVMAKKNYLYMMGGSRKEPERRLIIHLMNWTEKTAKQQGINFRVIKMPGVEHDFPEEYLGTLRAWIRKMVA